MIGQCCIAWMEEQNGVIKRKKGMGEDVYFV
jgi:hypothetical protein